MKKDWRPIETAPWGVDVLVYSPDDPYGHPYAVAERIERGWRITDGEYADPTHWMPLPEPPQ